MFPGLEKTLQVEIQGICLVHSVKNSFCLKKSWLKQRTWLFMTSILDSTCQSFLSFFLLRWHPEAPQGVRVRGVAASHGVAMPGETPSLPGPLRHACDGRPGRATPIGRAPAAAGEAGEPKAEGKAEEGQRSGGKTKRNTTQSGDRRLGHWRTPGS